MNNPIPKFRIGDSVAYSGPTFPWLHGRALTVVDMMPSRSEGYLYSVRVIGEKRGVRVHERNMQPYAYKPLRKRPFAVGARVKTIDRVAGDDHSVEGIVKELLEGGDVLVETTYGLKLKFQERLLLSVVETKKAPMSPGKMADDIATLKFAMNENTEHAVPAGLWAEGRRVRASIPGLLTRKTTLHTTPVRVVVANLPGALRYVP